MDIVTIMRIVSVSLIIVACIAMFKRDRFIAYSIASASHIFWAAESILLGRILQAGLSCAFCVLLVKWALDAYREDVASAQDSNKPRH